MCHKVLCQWPQVCMKPIPVSSLACFRFLIDLSDHWQFVLLAMALKSVEGLGSAGYFTASFTLITLLHPSSIGMVMVSKGGSGD